MNVTDAMWDTAMAVAKYNNGVQNAIDTNRYKGETEAMLHSMIISKPEDLLKVRCGARLIDRGTRERFVMTTLGILVNIDTGHMLDGRNSPYPLEIYRYARHR